MLSTLLSWLWDQRRLLGTLLGYATIASPIVIPATLLWARRIVARARETAAREREAIILDGRLAARRVVSTALQDAIRLGDKRIGAVKMR